MRLLGDDMPMNIEKYYVDGPIKGICKSHAIWGQDGGRISPVAYLRKPKYVTDEQWVEIVAAIKLELPVGFEIGT